MRVINITVLLSALMLSAGCAHMDGTFISFARYGESGEMFYEILPGEAAYEWMPKLMTELKPFEDAASPEAKALQNKYAAYLKDIKALRESGGEGSVKGNELVQKYFNLSLVFAVYADHALKSRDCYLLCEEGAVRIKLESGQKGAAKPEFFGPAPGFRGLVELLFTPEAQKRYEEFGGN
ncbi:MAG: hypothetical protein ACYS8W_03005 [Planctomycetota bacterium]|jgi:hypothetical protein